MSSKKTKSTKESNINKKSPRKKSNHIELVAPDCWINELAVIDIKDDSWKCSVTIIEEESTDSTVYMEHFNESTINGNRLSVKSISMLEIIHFVVKNIAEVHQGKSFTPLTLLCSEIFKLVGPEFQKKIPTQLLAPLIKYLILEYKDLNKTIREGIEKGKKEFEEYQQSLWQTPVKSISSKGTKSSKLEKKGIKSNNVTKVKTTEKLYTKLRKRGEEWKDKTWIDDSPHDGPQLYITISTFYDPDLPLELLKLNIPLNAVSKLSLWETSSPNRSTPTSGTTESKDIFQALKNFRHKSTPHLNSTIRKRHGNENDKTENSNTKIYNFWKNIHKLKTELPTALLFKNVMFLTFIPEHDCFQYQIKSFQEEIYKQISYFLYDIHEMIKQHNQYLSEIQQKNVHSDETFDLSNMKIYQSLLDSVPHETVSIPFLLDAIVIQVCGLEKEVVQKEPPQELEETNVMNIPVASNYLTKLLQKLNLKYDLFSDQFNYTFFNEDESQNDTAGCSIKHILKHFDDTNIKTFHLQEDIANFVRKRTAHIHKVAWNDILLRFFSIPQNDENIVKLCSEIIKTANDTVENNLSYYIYILTVNSILNSVLIHDFSYSTVKINSMKGNVPYERGNMCEDCALEVYNENFSMESFLRKTLSHISNSSSKISTYKLSDEIIESNLFYIEYMTTDVMLQWIQKVWYNFNKLETRYCPFTNQVVMVFHNLLSSKVFEEKWVGKLTTYVPIRDFVEYILEEEKEWLSQFHSKSTVESSNLEKALAIYIDKPFHDELPFLFPEHNFLSHRSLKYEMILKQQKPEKQLKEQSIEKTKSPKTKTISKKSDSSKKTKGTDKIKEKKISELKLVSVDSLKKETSKENYIFTGYDLGEPMRFQFNGLKKEKTLDGCCRITLQAMEKLYGEKSQALTVTISDHSLYYMYKPYSESTLTNPFHLILSSGIVLYFRPSNKESNELGIFDEIPNLIKRSSGSTKQASLLINNSVLETEFLAHQTVIPTLAENSRFVQSNDFTPNVRENSSCFLHTIKGIPYFEIPLTFDLKISLPNGLYVELARDSNLFYIRQILLSKSVLLRNVKNEKLRCYLSNGCIIKFLLNETLEVLSPNGMYYTVFEIKDKPLGSEKEEAAEPTDETIQKTTLSDINIRKNKRISVESSKSSKFKTVQKNEKKSTDSHNFTTFVKNEKNTQTMENISNLTTVNFECTTSNGKRFTIKNNEVTIVHKDLLITHTTNVAENCIDSERTDGVSTKHLADGSLLVQFKDGSRITSTPLEAGEVFCEWSSEELQKWFSDSKETLVLADTDLKAEKSLLIPNKSSLIENSLIATKIGKPSTIIENMHNEDIIQSEVLPNDNEKGVKLSEREESNIKYDSETIISKSSIGSLLFGTTDQYTIKKPFYHEDGFVFYNISYLMEHPNYGTVYYNANSCEVDLTLPLNTKITLKNDGCYEAYFDRANLTVDNDEIYFGKISEGGDFERTVIINNSATNNKNPVNLSNYFNRLNSLPQSVDEFCQSTGIKSLLRGMVMKTEIKRGLLLYCVDAKSNEIIVDYDFNIYELQGSKDKSLTSGIGNSFTSMVINENLSGFRLVGDEEVKGHLQLMTELHGLLQETDNAWKSLLTTVPAVTNESQKWLMNYQKNLTDKTKTLIKPSTYGRRESWIQPFVEKREKYQDLIGYKTVIVRLIHKIPAKENILDKLKAVVENYSKKPTNKNTPRTFLDESQVDFFSLDELIKNPELLCKIIKDENTKTIRKKDQFRRNMKHFFLRSLINKAVIKARKIRQHNKEKELKLSLRMREIPPYHLSGFGYVHSILDEVFENATHICTSSPTSSCEKVNYIIDELLSLVSKTQFRSKAKEFDDNTNTNETDSIGMKILVSGIFRNVCAILQDRNSQTHINAIMDKPLKLVTSDDIEFISKSFGSGDCPILNDEEFILQDVLDARLQLSNYFENLRSMLQFYRGTFPTQCDE